MKYHSILFAALLANASILSAQEPPRGDPLAGYLFPPELVMSNQLAISLENEQRSRIMVELQQAQSVLTEVQMRVGAESERMAQLLSAPLVDEGAVLDQVDRILELEREVKRRQMALLVRIRNILTPEQRRLLNAQRGKL
ncbi:MAG: periplasmic heavy metal sensor [Gemmatimonadetes bacterium]|nr:periplasmic heavy metal sensor [Gemmatimonadota bacterium]